MDKVARDFFKQEISEGDWVCCSSSSASTGMYIGQVTKITDKKIRLTEPSGRKHMKDHKKVFVVTAQCESIPELMI